MGVFLGSAEMQRRAECQLGVQEGYAIRLTIAVVDLRPASVPITKYFLCIVAKNKQLVSILQIFIVLFCVYGAYFFISLADTKNIISCLGKCLKLYVTEMIRL